MACVSNNINFFLFYFHKGAGTSIDVLTANKKLLVVINDELMNNHQIELADQLQKEGYCFYTNCKQLEESLSSLNFSDLNPYTQGNPNLFASFIDEISGVHKG